MRSILTVLLGILVCSLPALSQIENYEVQGKIIVSFDKIDGVWTPVAKQELPGAQYQSSDFGSYTYKILDADSNILFSGRLNLQDSIISEKVLPDGTVETEEIMLEHQTAVVPLLNESQWLQVFGPTGRIVAQLVINGDQPMRQCPPLPASTRNAPDYGGFLKSMPKVSQNPTDNSKNISPAGKFKKEKLFGHIYIKDLPADVKFSATMTFYRYEAGSKKSERSRIRGTGYKYETMDHYELKVPKGTYNVTLEIKTDEFPSDENPWYVNDVACHMVPFISSFNDVVIDDDVLANGLDFEIDPTEVTTFRITNDKGQPLRAHISLISDKFGKEFFCDAIEGPYFSDADGVLKLRLQKGVYSFIVVPSNPNSGNSMLVTREVSAEDNHFAFVCDRPGATSGAVLKQIWPESGSVSPSANKGKLNILFMAEGYTGIKEKFTDTNNNGYWDGDYFIDKNGNGKFDKKTEVLADLNRNGVYDKPEPFTDSNGDGVFNRYEREKFEATAAYLASGLLNSKPFNKNKNRIAIYSLWLPSKQATQKYDSYKKYSNSNTALGISISGTSCPYADDLNLVHNTAAAHLPDYTIPVVLIQDKQNHISANAMFNYGRILMSASDMLLLSTFRHEMGHSLGNLADEYHSANAPYTGPELPYPNLTIHNDFNKIKWKRFIKGDVPLPTVNGDPRVGLFIGAYYGNKGVYRPTTTSIMRWTSESWGPVNEAAIKKALKKFK